MPSKETQKKNAKTCWIDDIPMCQYSGFAFRTNSVYIEDGQPQEEHAFEDRSFFCQLDEVTYLYGLFDGFMGSRAAEFCLQRMAAEIVLGQLADKQNDDDIKEVLRQAYITVERSYLDSIDELLAEKLSLQLPVALPAFDAYLKYPHLFEKLKTINEKLSSGTSAAIVLIYRNRLYVANVGNSRVLMCKTDDNKVFRVVQLSVDHDLNNEDELLRLSQLGLCVDALQNDKQIGNQVTTRCIGNYLVKGGYKEYEHLRSAINEPVIAEPDIYGGIDVDECCQFLILASSGFYKCLEQVIPSNQVHKHIVQLVVEQFRSQSTLNNIAQVVVDKAIACYRSHNSSRKEHEDITFIIRNLNFPLAPTTVESAAIYSDDSMMITETDSPDASNCSSITSVYNLNPSGPNRLKPYVNFSSYYTNLKRAQNNQSFLHTV